MGIDAQLPVAAIGAGPVGLAAAAHLVSRGIRPVVLERGDAVGASVREWAHLGQAGCGCSERFLAEPGERQQVPAEVQS